MGESSHVPVKALECETQKDLILGLGRFLHGLEVSLGFTFWSIHNALHNTQLQ